MTAVEFLHSKYMKIFGELNPSTGKLVEIAYALEQAKEMEREQTIKGILDNRNITSQVTYLDAAEYFDRTFKQEP